jgi:hypothetical protein
MRAELGQACASAEGFWWLALQDSNGRADRRALILNGTGAAPRLEEGFEIVQVVVVVAPYAACRPAITVGICARPWRKSNVAMHWETGMDRVAEQKLTTPNLCRDPGLATLFSWFAFVPQGRTCAA